MLARPLVSYQSRKWQILMKWEKWTFWRAVNSMDFGFENIMDFAMNIDKLDLANMVREVQWWIR